MKYTQSFLIPRVEGMGVGSYLSYDSYYHSTLGITAADARTHYPNLAHLGCTSMLSWV